MIHDLDFATYLGKNLKIVASDITTNSDNSGAVVDCLLSNNSLKIHVHGNSMLPMGSPFCVGYEATFENASISYFEKSINTPLQTECYILTDGNKEKVTFELEEHCKHILRGAIKEFSDEKVSDLSIDNALPGLSIAFELTNLSSK